MSLGSVSDGNWHHVALRYDKSIFRLEGFLDGVKSANFATGDRTTPLEDTIARDGIFFGIGLANTTHLGNGAAFKGSIDEVRIWSVARTDAQIQANWQQTVDPDSAGLVAYYQFEDGSGTVASDSTSNGLDLTFINFTPTWVSADWFNGGAATVSVAVGATVTVTLDGQDPEDTGTLTARITAFSNGPRVTLQDDGNAAVISGAAPNYTLSTAAQRRLRITGNATGSETVTYVVNNGIADSASVTLTINVTGSANAPVINTTTGTFGPVNEDTSPVNITHANLIALLAVTDADTAAASLVFRVRGVSNGVLKKGGAEITPFVTTINNTESLDWHPPANNNGALSAFTVDVYDGAQYSTAIGTVQVNLTAQNDTPVTQELAAPAVPANTALFLDGVDDYLVTPDLSGYITNESVTLEIWFKPTTAAGVLNHGVIVSERGSSSLAGWRSTSIELLASGQVKARVWNLSAINLGSVLTNEWNHAVLIYNATTQRLSGYLNGVSSTTLSGGTATGDRRTPVEDGYPGIFYDVGASNPQNLGSGAFFKGYVAEFRVWSKARSAQSIVGSHLGQSLANEAGLVAWYKLDEAAGTIAATTADASGNARHATLSNSTSTMFVDADTLITASGSYVIPLEAMDPDGDSLTWVLKTPPTNGKIYHHLGGGVKGAQITALTTLGINPGTGTLADPDSVVYEPVAGTYTDTLVFYVQDANGVDSTDGTVTIDVAGVTRQAAGFAQSGSSGTAT
ncbi:MAG TPA: LamG-like jellyroll fold domain-containing protein, partial [Methylomirabilota bacterium]|nr:LamG-like jellyroll fold domain-containing protein [Methylomirabilota bacterium]